MQLQQSSTYFPVKNPFTTEIVSNLEELVFGTILVLKQKEKTRFQLSRPNN